MLAGKTLEPCLAALDGFFELGFAALISLDSTFQGFGLGFSFAIPTETEFIEL
jgi:hypothetical protein